MKGSQNLPVKLKEFRKKNHYSQEQVAEHLNISRQAISNWETGKAAPDIDNLVMLSELYGASVDEMLGDGERIKSIDNAIIMSDNNDYARLEILGLIAILFLAANIPFCAIPVSVVILVWITKTKRNYITIYVICIVCIVMGMQEFVSLYMHMNHISGTTIYVPLN